jgi:hypothetical protein
MEAPLGTATTRYVERIAAATGKSGGAASAQFEAHESLCGAGVLFLLPALVAQGLFKTKDVYNWTTHGYYSLESVVLTLALMALARIKTPEQLKQCKPGELGKTIGLDRIPEVRCLREKIAFLSDQNKSLELNKTLIDHWLPASDSFIFCIDGHQRVYHRHKANLPVKFISREKLCLPASTEFWVNDLQGNPIVVTLGELSEKLQTVIEQDIIPILNETAACKEKPVDNNQAILILNYSHVMECRQALAEKCYTYPSIKK